MTNKNFKIGSVTINEEDLKSFFTKKSDELIEYQNIIKKEYGEEYSLDGYFDDCEYIVLHIIDGDNNEIIDAEILKFEPKFNRFERLLFISLFKDYRNDILSGIFKEED